MYRRILIVELCVETPKNGLEPRLSSLSSKCIFQWVILECISPLRKVTILLESNSDSRLLLPLNRLTSHAEGNLKINGGPALQCKKVGEKLGICTYIERDFCRWWPGFGFPPNVITLTKMCVMGPRAREKIRKENFGDI